MDSPKNILTRIAFDDGNVLGAYYSFYNDGKWLLDVCNKTLSTSHLMADGNISDYAKHFPIPVLPK